MVPAKKRRINNNAMLYTAIRDAFLEAVCERWVDNPCQTDTYLWYDENWDWLLTNTKENLKNGPNRILWMKPNKHDQESYFKGDVFADAVNKLDKKYSDLKRWFFRYGRSSKKSKIQVLCNKSDINHTKSTTVCNLESQNCSSGVLACSDPNLPCVQVTAFSTAVLQLHAESSMLDSSCSREQNSDNSQYYTLREIKQSPLSPNQLEDLGENQQRKLSGSLQSQIENQPNDLVENQQSIVCEIPKNDLRNNKPNILSETQQKNDLSGNKPIILSGNQQKDDLSGNKPSILSENQQNDLRESKPSILSENQQYDLGKNTPSILSENQQKDDLCMNQQGFSSENQQNDKRNDLGGIQKSILSPNQQIPMSGNLQGNMDHSQPPSQMETLLCFDGAISIQITPKGKELGINLQKMRLNKDAEREWVYCKLLERYLNLETSDEPTALTELNQYLSQMFKVLKAQTKYSRESEFRRNLKPMLDITETKDDDFKNLLRKILKCEKSNASI